MLLGSVSDQSKNYMIRVKNKLVFNKKKGFSLRFLTRVT